MLACPRCGSSFQRDVVFCGLDGERLQKFDRDPLLGRTLDRYRLDAVLGDGGMARVYRATHVHLEQSVAVKILFGDMASDRGLAERFRREAQSAAQIQHPNVVHVTDFGVTADKLSFLAMELLEGPTLSEIIRADPRTNLPPERVAELVRQLALGLEAAHKLGFVHRDLKPKNVMVVQRAGVELAKILDFGLVRPLDDGEIRLTQKGQIFGTPAYMAPEQIADGRIDARTDLYALGAMLYELLSGNPPFDGTMGEVFRKHLSEAPKPPPGNQGLSNLSLLLLAKSPEGRPASAREVVEILDSLGLARPVPALLASDAPRTFVSRGLAPALPPEPRVSAEPKPTRAAPLPSAALQEQLGTATPAHGSRRISVDPLGVGVVDSHELSQVEIKRALQAVDDGRRRSVVLGVLALGAMAALIIWALSSGSGEPTPETEDAGAVVSLAPDAEPTTVVVAKAADASALDAPAAPDAAARDATPAPDHVPIPTVRAGDLPDPTELLRPFPDLDRELRGLLSDRGLHLRDLTAASPDAVRDWVLWRQRADQSGADARLAAFKALVDAARATEPTPALLAAKLIRVRAILARRTGPGADVERKRLGDMEQEARAKLDPKRRAALVRRLSFLESELEP